MVRYTSSNESLFYSANNGNYFGEYTTQGFNLVVGGHLSKASNTGLREVLTTKSAKMGELAQSDLAGKQSSLPGHRHGHRSFFEIIKRAIGHQPAKTMDTDPNNEQVHHYIQSIKDMKPWNHQQSMVVGSGDTFESIARNFAGSANAALDVALENGFSGDALITQRKIVRRAVSSVAFLRYSKLLCGDAIKGARSLVLAARHVLPSVFMGGNPRYIPLAEPIASDDWQTWELVKKLREKLAEAADNPLTVGQVIMLPQYTPSTYTASSATPLSALTGEIEGSFLPHLVWAQKHHHFWQVFFRILILLTDMVVSVAAATFGPYLDALITAATDAVMQGLYYEMGLIDDFSWEEVIGAGISGATAGIGGVDKIMTAASHLESIAVVAEAVGIVVAENVAQQLAEMATGLRKHFSMRELLVSAATFIVNAVANTSLSLNQSGILNSVERSLVDAGLDELTGSAIMGRNPSLESALDQFGMNLGSNLLSGMVEEIKEATKEGEKATARASKQTSMYKPVDALSAGKKAWWGVWAQTNYQTTADHDSQSLNNAAQVHNTVNAKDFNYGDWYKDTLVYAKAASHFNKSEAASGFINPANDFAGYMNMLTSQLSPAPQYHNFVESSPTSAQPKAVDHWYERVVRSLQLSAVGQAQAVNDLVLQPLNTVNEEVLIPLGPAAGDLGYGLRLLGLESVVGARLSLANIRGMSVAAETTAVAEVGLTAEIRAAEEAVAQGLDEAGIPTPGVATPPRGSLSRVSVLGNKSPEPFAIDPENAVPSGSVGSVRAWTKKARIKTAQLPNEGKVRFVPDDGYHPSVPLTKGNNKGYLDKFGNEWTKGPSRTSGQPFEWDVQLSSLGKKKFGWASRDGSHLNVSLDGKITHR